MNLKAFLINMHFHVKENSCMKCTASLHSGIQKFKISLVNFLVYTLVLDSLQEHFGIYVI